MREHITEQLLIILGTIDGALTADQIRVKVRPKLLDLIAMLEMVKAFPEWKAVHFNTKTEV